jgi:hypothetical protein
MKVLIAFTLVGAIFSCAGITPKKPTQLPLAQQEERAEAKYLDLLESTARMPRKERSDILVEGYKDVIKNYPESSFAEESHYHLIKIYFYNYDAPMESQAENIYRKYFKNYEKPRMSSIINLEMAKYYYQFRQWDKLVTFTVPFLRKYLKTGKIDDGLYIFYYSEAKYQLKEYKEALRGYVTFADKYKENKMEKFIKRRLRQIDHLMEKQKSGK